MGMRDESTQYIPTFFLGVFLGVKGPPSQGVLPPFSPMSHGLRGGDAAMPDGLFYILHNKSSPLKMGHPKRKLVFQPSIFRGYV